MIRYLDLINFHGKTDTIPTYIHNFFRGITRNSRYWTISVIVDCRRDRGFRTGREWPGSVTDASENLYTDPRYF